ncbi:CRE-CLEC-196 protein [Caenorhabditis remanei]|uniref:CRE-CLEC-196 protein n=1 Tax=Caenorhabditis remanei TaxID=31234 RepID=E3MK07_CAERE|nr:CRE-CLEC-196 protein [Caenorhabditis remanei]
MRFATSLIFVSIILLVSGNRRFGFGVKTCPKGWLQFQRHCYIRQPDTLDFKGAMESCARQGATLFQFDSTFEFAAVRNLFPDYMFTWLQAEIEEELEWLYEPYEEKINGKNTVATCIAFYSSPTKSYNYYYPCTSRFHSICEKPLDAFHVWVA